MKRVTFFLLVLMISKIGTSYAAPSINTSPMQNFFVGGPKTDRLTINQVLSLIVGPQGKPGPAGRNGIAGRDGRPGPAGPAGLAGAQGPAGAAGPAGPTGAAGPAGATGAQGPAGGGGGGGGTLGTGQGNVDVIGCSTLEDPVKVLLVHSFDNSRREFFLNGITFENVSPNCIKAGNRMVLTMSVQSGALFYADQNEYISSDVIECIHPFSDLDLTAAQRVGPPINLKVFNTTNSRANQFIGGANLGADDVQIPFNCRISERSGVVLNYRDPILMENTDGKSIISTRDIYGAISFEFSPQP